MLVLPARSLVLGAALRIARLSEFANIFTDMEKVDQLALGMLLEEAPVARGAIGDPHIARVGIMLLGAGDLAGQALVERLLAVLGCGGEVDGVAALAVMVVEPELCSNCT